MGTELEWKYELPEQRSAEEILAWDSVRARIAETPRLFHMRTSYFDTPDRRFAERRITVRRRMENERSVFCVKAPLQGADARLRGEWETEAASLAEALPRLAALGAPIDPASAKELAPVCGAEFQRRAVLLRFEDGSAAELALDRGRLFGPERSIPLHELELELKEGEPDAAESFAQELAARFGLTLQEKSKFARAQAL